MRRRSSQMGWTDLNPLKAVSAGITCLFWRLGISADIATLLILVPALAGAAAFLVGGRWLWVAGGGLFILAFVMDKVNGALARRYGTVSFRGAYLDGVMDTLRRSLMISSVAWALYKDLGLVAGPALGYAMIVFLLWYNFVEKSAFLLAAKAGRSILDIGAYDDPGTRRATGLKRAGFLLVGSPSMEIVLLVCAVVEALLWSAAGGWFMIAWLSAYGAAFACGTCVRGWECLLSVGKDATEERKDRRGRR